MSNVTAVSVLLTQSNQTLSQPKNKPSSSGTSSITWNFLGVYLNGNRNAVAVFQAGTNRDAGAVNGARDGGVFDEGTTGVYCYLTSDSTDINNWSMGLRTGRDGAGKGVVYTASSGGGY